MQIRRAALVTVVLVAGAVAAVRAADQTVLGKSFVVKDPQPSVNASLRIITALGKEPTTDDTVVGDPVANGATIEIIANGTTSGDQVFSLPAGASVSGSPGWKALGTIGFSYKDAAGANGPVKTALIKRANNGVFIVKAVIKGSQGPGPQPHITVVPPAPGTDGGMRFTINGGDSYCVAFGGAAGGVVKNAPPPTNAKLFKVIGATGEGCPVAASTTTSTTSSTTTSTSTTTCPPGPPPSPAVLKGSLTATPGRFNYNLTLGLPGANAACNTNFAGTHACSYSELQTAAAACDLPGLKDTSNITVTSFWAIDSAAAALVQCVDDAVGGSNQRWEYGTAHTASRGQRVSLNNTTGALGSLQTGVQCNISGNSWVGCCQ